MHVFHLSSVQKVVYMENTDYAVCGIIYGGCMRPCCDGSCSIVLVTDKESEKQYQQALLNALLHVDFPFLNFAISTLFLSSIQNDILLVVRIKAAKYKSNHYNQLVVLVSPMVVCPLNGVDCMSA